MRLAEFTTIVRSEWAQVVSSKLTPADDYGWKIYRGDGEWQDVDLIKRKEQK